MRKTFAPRGVMSRVVALLSASSLVSCTASSFVTENPSGSISELPISELPISELPIAEDSPVQTSIDFKSESLTSEVNSQNNLELSWEATGPSVQIEMQASLDGDIWETIASVESSLGGLAVAGSSLALADGNYNIRVIVPGETVELGSILIDTTPPQLSENGENGVFFGCQAVPGFDGATDNLGPVTYHLVSPTTISGISGCLDGSSSTTCDLVSPEGLPDGPVTYKAVDQAGNETEGVLYIVNCEAN